MPPSGAGAPVGMPPSGAAGPLGNQPSGNTCDGLGRSAGVAGGAGGGGAGGGGGCARPWFAPARARRAAAASRKKTLPERAPVLIRSAQEPMPDTVVIVVIIGKVDLFRLAGPAEMLRS